MHESLLKHLVCPKCNADLKLQATEQVDARVKEGRLCCQSPACGSDFAITGFVPRFVDRDQYATTFSSQRLYVRKHFQDYLADKSGDKQFLPTTGITTGNLQSGVTLEVGCGYGRFLDVVSRAGGEIIGVDLSSHSIELANDFVGARPNVHVVQCDLHAMPFRRNYFANVYSIGVLHHTPDTRQAFEAIVPYARSGGRISIWVYHPDEKRSSDRWRLLTTRLPQKLVYAGCIVNQACFTWIRALPGGWRFNSLIPGMMPNGRRTFWMRVLGDFDNLTPTYAFTHTPDEVQKWFENAGLTDIVVQSRKTAVTGIRP